MTNAILNKDNRQQAKNRGVFLNTPLIAPMLVVFQMIIDTFEIGKPETLTLNHLNIEQIDPADHTTIIYKITNLPLGFVILGGTENSGVISFTHQDLLEGKISFTITDASLIESIELNTIYGELIIANSPIASSASQNDGFQSIAGPLQVIVPEDYEQPEPEKNNDINLSEIPTGYRINGDKGDDVIVAGSGDDVVIGGEGDDKIDIGAGGKDSIIYAVGMGGKIYAFNGADVIEGFKRDEDVFIIQVADESLAPPDLDAFFDAVNGLDPNAVEEDDR